MSCHDIIKIINQLSRLGYFTLVLKKDGEIYLVKPCVEYSRLERDAQIKIATVNKLQPKILPHYPPHACRLKQVLLWQCKSFLMELDKP